MKIDLTDLSPVRKRMSIEVAADEVARQADTVLRGYRKKARIPGFRQGKAPMAVVRSRFAKELEEEVRERVVSASFVEATKEKGLEPLGDPALENLSHEEGQPLSFDTVFEVLPEITLKDYRGIEVRRPPVEVSDEEVADALEEIRRSRVRLTAVGGRGAEKGDVVYADVEGTPDEGEPIRRERLPIELGSDNNIDEFNEKLLGARAGAELEFPVDYPADYGAKHLAGRRVDYRLAVREVKQPILPDLDDELAKDLGEFDDLEALKAKVRADLGQRKQREAETATRQSLLDKVLIQNPAVLPDVLVERELRRRLEDFVSNLILRGVDPKQVDIDWERLRNEQEEPARKSVHARLILDAVARAEGIEIDESDIDARIRKDAEHIGESADKLRARVKDRSAKEALRTQLVREKSLDYLMTVANIR